MENKNLLESMFKQQEDFLHLLKEKRAHPDFPLDLSVKKNQQFLKTLTYECMHELFESNILLKNAKQHRATEISEFDRNEYMEELSDVLHYLLAILIYSGISLDEIYEAFMKKGEVNFDRINSGY